MEKSMDEALAAQAQSQEIQAYAPVRNGNDLGQRDPVTSRFQATGKYAQGTASPVYRFHPQLQRGADGQHQETGIQAIVERAFAAVAHRGIGIQGEGPVRGGFRGGPAYLQFHHRLGDGGSVRIHYAALEVQRLPVRYPYEGECE